MLENKPNRGKGALSTRLTTSSSGPLYAIHNGKRLRVPTLAPDRNFSLFFFCLTAPGDLSFRTVATNATHYGGRTELEMHNLFGHLMSRAANLAVREMYPGKRPFLISRSTFAGSGTWTGHWVGYIFLMIQVSISDFAVSWETTGASGRICTIAFRGYYSSNFSKSQWLEQTLVDSVRELNIVISMLVFTLSHYFAGGNADEELCNRWMQLAAFTPFYRNHNILGAIPQEPYRWDSVAHATRVATAVRYALLPYWARLFPC